MLPTFAIGLAAAGLAAAQGVASVLTPTASAPPGCSADYSGSFELTVALTGQKRAVVEERDALVVSLSGGVLTDLDGRIGEIVANRQFQFDAPPGQASAVYTGGWSVCSGGALALGGSTAFFQCPSGGFYNLYDQHVDGQCQQVQLNAVPIGAAAALSQAPDGQVQGTSAATPAPALTPVSQNTTGQVQGTAQPVVQISDGQVQAPAATSAPPAVTPPGQVPTSGSTFASTFTTANATTTSAASSSPASSRAASASARPSNAASPVSAGAHIVAVAVAVAAAVVLV